ncbi:MAG: hypothetical protein JO306_01445 [Gemmatimonadetes bacterium]|nr:hypothetical protein [Gemmatimonadota bacterium]
MKKLRLDVEKISVDEFATSPENEGAGTVVGLDELTGAAATNCLHDTCWNQSCVTGPPSPCRPCP